MSDETTSERATCATCRFWGGWDADWRGDCKRSSPGPHGWPGTIGHDWCGEHAPKGEEGSSDA